MIQPDPLRRYVLATWVQLYDFLRAEIYHNKQQHDSVMIAKIHSDVHKVLACISAETAEGAEIEKGKQGFPAQQHANSGRIAVDLEILMGWR
jgi:hypothetical protein